MLGKDGDTGIAPRAFTLIELLVVISIIALLLAIMPSNRAGHYSGQEPTRRTTELTNLGRIYVRLEEDEGRGAHNWGSWTLDKDGNSFWDSISIWHKKSSTLGYADGHAELNLWKEKTTWQVSTGELPPGTAVSGSEDLRYMQEGYVVRRCVCFLKEEYHV
jgi:prepilin-type N-terminal cleavage/methylation domain-containing protein